MKTTDLIYQNQEVLNALQEMLLQTKKHVEFLAADSPENTYQLGKHRRMPANGCWYFGKSNCV